MFSKFASLFKHHEIAEQQPQTNEAENNTASPHKSQQLSCENLRQLNKAHEDDEQKRLNNELQRKMLSARREHGNTRPADKGEFKPTPLFNRGISGHQVYVTANACGTEGIGMPPGLIAPVGHSNYPIKRHNIVRSNSSSLERGSRRSLTRDALRRELRDSGNNVDNDSPVRSRSSFRSQVSARSLLGEKPAFIPETSPHAPVREQNASRSSMVRQESPEMDTVNWREGNSRSRIHREPSVRAPLQKEGSFKRSSSYRTGNLERTMTQGSILGQAPPSILGCGEASKRSILGDAQPQDVNVLAGSRTNSFRRQQSGGAHELERSVTQGSILGCGALAEEKLRVSKSNLLREKESPPVDEKKFLVENNEDVVPLVPGRKSLLRFKNKLSRSDTPAPQDLSATIDRQRLSSVSTSHSILGGHNNSQQFLSRTGNPPGLDAAPHRMHSHNAMTNTMNRSSFVRPPMPSVSSHRMPQSTSRSLLGQAVSRPDASYTTSSPMGHGLPYAVSQTIHEENFLVGMPPGLIAPPGLEQPPRTLSLASLINSGSSSKRTSSSGSNNNSNAKTLFGRSASGVAAGPDGSGGFRMRRTNSNFSAKDVQIAA